MSRSWDKRWSQTLLQFVALVAYVVIVCVPGVRGGLRGGALWGTALIFAASWFAAMAWKIDVLTAPTGAGTSDPTAATTSSPAAEPPGADPALADQERSP